MIFKSAGGTELLFESGRTEMWPGVSLDLVTKAYKRRRGRGVLMSARAFVLSLPPFNRRTVCPTAQPLM